MKGPKLLQSSGRFKEKSERIQTFLSIPQSGGKCRMIMMKWSCTVEPTSMAWCFFNVLQEEIKRLAVFLNQAAIINST